MPLRIGLEIECPLLVHNPPRSSNLGTEQSAIHQHSGRIQCIHGRYLIGERMVAERSMQASTTAAAEGRRRGLSGMIFSVRPGDENTTQGNPAFSKFEPSWNIWQKPFTAVHFRDAFFL
jgi:hypothetical protein